MFYYFLDQYQDAINDCTKVIEINPADADVYFCKDMAYEELGQLQNADADYD